ncbi:helix-turn-helix domain-containing protein [Streptomyces sp. NBC_00243]|uniref:IclR family transcriptional regulator n=1 Tax=Streptomyces sp. NBC_00243 TaxID=2975688 RepID=UPI002DDB1445|nr:IclR family transcriptional regulator C-terminal domain-containing protein [Streptomyces sp. NBC_00243]WRZ19437.1 helix-turn-helix domain-containing protein [Streptomyces sp. NBC_00243]
MGESVAGRVFSVLDAFEGAPDTLRLTEIARRTGLPLPTALRMVRELVAWGGLERATDGSYRLGTRIRALGAAAPCPRGLLDAALPALRALTARTGGHADVAVPADGTALCLVSGERLPLHATAAGKILLAYGHGVPATAVRHTPYTLTAPGALGAQLTRIRETGLAEGHEEYRLGELSLAAPISRTGRTVAAVTVTSGTGTPRLRLAPAVREAAVAIGRALDAPPRATARP